MTSKSNMAYVYMSIRMTVEFQQKSAEALCFTKHCCEVFYSFVQLYFERKLTVQIQALRRWKLPE